MITEIEFKGIKALKLENEKLRVIVIPGLGGKIASLIKKDKNFEIFFQHKEEAFRKPGLYSDFSRYDASGFDDCFPSVDESIVYINGNKIRYPDHGEIWSKSLDYAITGNVLKLWCSSDILTCSYEKDISIEGDKLHLYYKILNTGKEPFPCIWTMHGLVNCEESMEIFLPAGTDQIVNVQESRVFGAPGVICSFPEALPAGEKIYRADRVGSVHEGKTEKFYVEGILSEGVCGVYYPSKDLSYKINFDKEQLPYLGVWITEGGFRGDYNMALEPSNGFYDSIDIAEKNVKLQKLHPGKILEFNLNIEISDGNNLK